MDNQKPNQQQGQGDKQQKGQPGGSPQERGNEGQQGGQKQNQGNQGQGSGSHQGGKH